MTSTTKISLNDAIAAMDKAYARLEAVTNVAVHDRNESAALREAIQNEISLSWQSHTSQLETTLTQTTSENEFLKQDNLRLSNQLQQLQADYLDLQQTTGDIIGRLDSAVDQIDMILQH